MARTSTVYSLALASVLLTATSRADEAPLEHTLGARWTEAYNSGDIEALSAMYAADARLQQGYCPAVEGREAIEAFWRGDVGEGTSTTHLEVNDSLSVEGLIYVSGNYAVEVTDGAEPPNRTHGTYVQIWRRDDAARWTIVRETWTNLACAKIRLHSEPGEAVEVLSDATAI